MSNPWNPDDLPPKPNPWNPDDPHNPSNLSWDHPDNPQTNANTPEQIEHWQKVHADIAELAEQVAETCHGKTFLVIKGAMAHMLAQILIRSSEFKLDAADKQIDALGKAMKLDVRQLVQRHEVMELEQRMTDEADLQMNEKQALHEQRMQRPAAEDAVEAE